MDVDVFIKTIPKRKVLKNVPLKIKCIILDKLNKEVSLEFPFFFTSQLKSLNQLYDNHYLHFLRSEQSFSALLSLTPTFPPDQ